MKKTILFAVIAILGMNFGYSQQGNFSMGINAGVPVGDIEEFVTFNVGADVAYRFQVAEQFEVGALAGYSHFFGDSGEDEFGSWEVDDIQFLPVAATARVKMSSFFAGADVGYAVGINEGNQGAFYYRPHAGFSFGKLAVLASYAAISRDGMTVASANLGLEFRL